jgi:hypothetical protein
MLLLAAVVGAWYLGRREPRPQGGEGRR